MEEINKAKALLKTYGNFGYIKIIIARAKLKGVSVNATQIGNALSKGYGKNAPLIQELFLAFVAEKVQELKEMGVK